MLDPSDDELVRRVLAGDKGQAFELLHTRHAPLVRAVATAVVGPTDAPDACQDAWLRAFLRLSTYVPGGRFGGWLAILTRNLAIDELRRRALRVVVGGDVTGWWPDPAPGPEAAYLAREAADALMLRVLGLPPLLAPALTLVCATGLDYATASAALGVPKTTIRMRVWQGRQRLRAVSA